MTGLTFDHKPEFVRIFDDDFNAGHDPYNHFGRHVLPAKEREDLAAWLEGFDIQCEDLRTKCLDFLGRNG